MANKKLFDAHCHLQDPRIYNVAPQLIRTAMDSGVIRFAVNGVSEKDWHVVKQMGEQYPRSIIPCFGLHPWYVAERTPNWFNTLKDFFDSTPSATVGEIGLDKGSHGKKIDFVDQVQVFQQQLELAKELQKPVSIHCVRAFGDLLAIMQNVGPFPGGAILHSYLGSAEMVPGLAKLGAYFSFSGYLMSMEPQKAKKMLKSVPTERILLESDSPDALPISKIDSLQWVPGDSSVPEELHHKGKDSSNIKDPVDGQFHASRDASTLPKETLNHPANIHNHSCTMDILAQWLMMKGENTVKTPEDNFGNMTQFMEKIYMKVDGLTTFIQHTDGENSWLDEEASSQRRYWIKFSH